MKKNLLITGMLLTIFLFGTYAMAEEGENKDTSVEQTTTETKINDDKESSEEAFIDHYINIKIQIDLLVKNGDLTKEQGDSFLAKVESAKTGEELNIIWQEVEKQVTTNKDVSKGAFIDHYINIKIQIDLLVKNSDLTKEQGDSFLAKVESAKTGEELNIIWQEVEKQVTTNKTATTSSTEKEINKDSKITNQLPKTGESKINIGLVGIGFVLILSFVVIKFKSKKLNN